MATVFHSTLHRLYSRKKAVILYKKEDNIMKFTEIDMSKWPRGQMFFASLSCFNRK